MKEKQLSRIEEKMDRILDLIDSKELSKSTNSIEVGNLSDIPEDVLKRNGLGKYSN